jgi:hypothetical protein
MSQSAGIDRADRRHRDRATPPVRAFVQVLPHVLDPSRVAIDEERNHVIAQVARHRELAAVQRRIAKTVHTVFGHELERDEVPSGTADDDFRVCDAHKESGLRAWG